MTLVVHPRFGEEISVVSSFGEHAVWAETSDGKLRIFPLAWTSLQPRREPLALDGRAVRLDPAALRELAAWVASRAAKLAPESAE